MATTTPKPPALPPGWERAGEGTTARTAAPPAEPALPAPAEPLLPASAQPLLPASAQPLLLAPAGRQPRGRAAAEGGGTPAGPPVPEDESRPDDADGHPFPAEGEARVGPAEAEAGRAEAEVGHVDPEAGQSLRIQLSALQAMCRHVFAFRLAMIALAAPFALVHAAPGLAARLVGAAVVVTFMGSYVLFRDWERFGPLLLRHPTLLAADTLFGALLLIAAGPDSTLAYVSVCTPLLAGLVYGCRGAAIFASLQSLILLLIHAAQQELHAHLAQSALFPGLCLIAGAAGATQRTLLLRFGAATRALTQVQARLAATEAVSEERARLARDMHDSVAKTLHGAALAAAALAATAATAPPDPALVRRRAALVARSARRAAAEARDLLTDLRREQDPSHRTGPLTEPQRTDLLTEPQRTDLLTELTAVTRDFTTRTGLPATCHSTGAPAAQAGQAQAARSHGADGEDAQPAVQVGDVDGDAHAEGVHAARGGEEHRAVEPVAAQQAPGARAVGGRQLQRDRDRGRALRAVRPVHEQFPVSVPPATDPSGPQGHTPPPPRARRTSVPRTCSCVPPDDRNRPAPCPVWVHRPMRSATGPARVPACAYF